MAKHRAPPDGRLWACALAVLLVLACVPAAKALDACLTRPWQQPGSSSQSQPTVVSLSSFEELQELVDATEGPATFVLDTGQAPLASNKPLHINRSDITIAASREWLAFGAVSTGGAAATPARLPVSCSAGGSLLQVDHAVGITVLGLLVTGCSSSAVRLNTAKGVVLRGCDFTANSNHSNGGAVEALRSQLWVDGCSFQANAAGGGSGGAIAATMTQLLVSDSRFGSNSAGSSGGAVAMRGRSPDAAASAAAGSAAACWQDTDGILIHAAFSNNRAKLQGGVLASNGSHIVMQNASASGNKARYGGVAYLGQTAQLTIRGNSSMTSNMAASSGGVVYAVSPGARIALAGSSFANNTAKILGGVVSAKEAASVRLDDCQFSNNTADLAAGVVYARDADMVASGCAFHNNSAKRDGGALYCAGGCAWKMRGCTFRDNQCGANGGAIFGWNVEASIANSSLEDNSAGALGGGVAVANSTLELKACKLGSNNAYGSDAAGGGLYSQGSNLNLTDCYMAGNVASWGGAVYITNSTLALAGGGIANSSATGSGAALYVLRSVAAITNATLSYNDAQQHGGSVYCTDSACSFSGCDILGDSATQGGGCFWVGRGSLNLRRSNIAGCVSAGYDGGGVYAAGAASVTVSCCSFKGCSALKGSGGALWLSGVRSVGIRGSLFAQNQAMFGGSMYISNSTTSIGSSSIINSTATVGGGIAATLSSDLMLFNSTAVAGNAAAVGGGIAVDSMRLTLTGPVTVSWNKALRPALAATAVTTPAAAAAAAADAASAAAKASVSPSAVFGGQAVLRGLGGGLYAHNSKVMGSELRLDRNTADRVGAGAYLDRCGSRLVSSSISRNQAIEQAGGLKLLNPAQGSALLNVTVSNNWAGLKGGGVAVVGVDLASEVALVDVALVNNSASGQAGGGLWLSGPLGLLMVGGEVSGNTAGTSAVAAAAAAAESAAGGSDASMQAAGGGLLLEDCSWAALHGVDVLGNAALAGCGGGLALSGCGKFLLSGSTVLGNVAGSGGGLCATDMLSFMTLAGSTISANRVLLGGLWDSGAAYPAALSPTPEPHLHCGVQGTGGGMCISSLGEVLINGSTISKNQARNGGAMALGLCSDGDKCSLGLVGTKFLNNTAVQGGGGAVYFSTAVSPYQVRCGEDYNSSSVSGYAKGTSFPSLASLLDSAAFLHSSSNGTGAAASSGPQPAGSNTASGSGSAAAGPGASSGSGSSGVSINEGVDTLNPTPAPSHTSSEDDILVSTPGSHPGGHPGDTTTTDGSAGSGTGSSSSGDYGAHSTETFTPDFTGSGYPATTTVSFDADDGAAAAAQAVGTNMPTVPMATAVAGASQAESARAGDGIPAASATPSTLAAQVPSAAATAPASSSSSTAVGSADDDDVDASTDGFIPPGGPSPAIDPDTFTIASVPEVRHAAKVPADSTLAAFQASSAKIAAGLQQKQQPQQRGSPTPGAHGQQAAVAAAAAAGSARHKQHQHSAEVLLPGGPDAALAASTDAAALAAPAAVSVDEYSGQTEDGKLDWELADATEGVRVISGPQERSAADAAEAGALLAAAMSTAAASRPAGAGSSSVATAAVGGPAGLAGMDPAAEQQQQQAARGGLTEVAARTLAVPVTLTVLQAAEKAGVHPKVTTAWQRIGTVSLGALMDAGVVDAALLGSFWPAYPKSSKDAPAEAAAGSKVAGWQQQFYANLAVVLSQAAAQQDRPAGSSQAQRRGQGAAPYSACDPVQNPAACPVPKSARAQQHTGPSARFAADPGAAAAELVGFQQERGASISRSRGRSSTSAASSALGRRLAQVEEMVVAAEDAAGNMTFMSTDITTVGAPAPAAAAGSSSFILQGVSQCGLFQHNAALGARAYGPVVTSRPAGLRVWGSVTANDTSSILVATGGQLQVQVSVVDVFGGIVTSGAADFIRIRATLMPPLGAAGAAGRKGSNELLSAAAADLISRANNNREVDDNGVELSGLQQLSTSNGSLILSGLQLSGLPGTNTTLFITASDPTLLPASLPITLTSCSAGYMQLPGQCQMCPVGTFSFTADEPLCSLCPVGASCNGTMLVPAAGYWQSTPRSAQVHACLNPAACDRDALHQQQLADWQATHYGRGAIVGKSREALGRELEHYMADQCAAGYSGRMCGVCTQEPAAIEANRMSHGMVGGACVACGERKTVIGTFVLVRLFDLGLWAVLTFLACKAANAWAEAIALNPATAAATAGSLPPASSAAAGSSMGRHRGQPAVKGELVLVSSATAAAAVAEVPVSAVLHAHVSVFFDYLQMLSVISASAASYAWPRVLKTFMAAFAFVPLGTSRWVSAECLLPYSLSSRHSIAGLLLTAALPLLYLMSSAAVWILGLFRGHTHRAAMMALIAGTGLFYPLITMSALSVFSCHSLDDSKLALPGEQLSAVGSYWTLDPELKCYEGQHLQLTLGFGLPVVLLVVFAWPLLLASMLWDSRFRIRDQQLHPATRRRYLVRKTIKMCHQILGVMSGFIRPRLYLWPVVAEVRKLLLCVVVVLVAGSPAPVQLYVLWGLVASMLVLEWWLRPGATWPIVGLQLVALGAVQGVIYLASAFTQMSLAGSAASFSALIIVLCCMVAVTLFLSLAAAFKANTWLLKALDVDKDGKVSRQDFVQSASKLLSFGVQHYKDDSDASATGGKSGAAGSASSTVGSGSSRSRSGVWKGAVLLFNKHRMAVQAAAAVGAQDTTLSDGDSVHDQAGSASAARSPSPLGGLARSPRLVASSLPITHAAMAAAEGTAAGGAAGEGAVPTSSSIDMGMLAMLRQVHGAGSIQDAAALAAAHSSQAEGMQQQQPGHLAVDLGQFSNSAAMRRDRQLQQQQQVQRARPHHAVNMARANSLGAPGPNGSRMPLHAYMSVQQWLEQSGEDLTHGPKHPDVAGMGLGSLNTDLPSMNAGSRATSMGRSRSLQLSASSPAPQLAVLRSSSGSLALQRAQFLQQFQQQQGFNEDAVDLSTLKSVSESERQQQQRQQQRRRLTGAAAAARAQEIAAAATAGSGRVDDTEAAGTDAAPAVRHQPYYALWSNIASAITGPSGSIGSNAAAGGRPPAASPHGSRHSSVRQQSSSHSSSRRGVAAASGSVTRSSRGMHSSSFAIGSITSSNHSARVRPSPFAAAAVAATAAGSGPTKGPGVRPSPFAAATVGSGAAGGPGMSAVRATSAPDAHAATAALAATAAGAPSVSKGRHSSSYSMWQAAIAEASGDASDAVAAADSPAAAAYQQQQGSSGPGMTAQSAATAPPVVLEPRRHKQYIGMWGAALADELGDDGPSAVGAATPGPVVPQEVAAAFAAAMVANPAAAGSAGLSARTQSGVASSSTNVQTTAAQQAAQSPVQHQQLPGRVRPSPFATMGAAAAVIGMEQVEGAADAAQQPQQQRQRHRRRPGRRPRDSAGTCSDSD